MVGILRSDQREALVAQYKTERDGRIGIASRSRNLGRYQYSLMQGTLVNDEARYFMASIHPQYRIRACYGRICKNQNKTLRTFSGWKRKHIIGAIELDGLKVISSESNIASTFFRRESVCRI